MVDLVIFDIESVRLICSLLSNINRLKLIKFLSDGKYHSLRDVHNFVRTKAILSDRETTYKYLEKLKDGGILEKKDEESGRVKYRLKLTKLTILLSRLK